MGTIPFHSKSADEVLYELASSYDGIAEEEARKRFLKYGENVITNTHKRSTIDIFLNQFKNFIIWLLFIAAGIAYYIGHLIDALAILIACLISVIFGFILEYRADSSLRALQALTAPKAVVIRNGKHTIIDAKDIVPGDILILEDGMKVAADARIIENYGLEINESILTGESLSVQKTKKQLQEETPIHAHANMVYSGTLVIKGHGKAVVVATGNKTEFGKIASALSEVEGERTVLQIALDDLGKKISIFSIIIIFLLITFGALKGMTIADLAILGISLAVASVPEGLLTVLTIIVALGVRKMAEQKALVRSLGAVETVGKVTTLIVDKTGTITEGRFALSSIYTNNTNYDAREFEDNNKILLFASLCNTAKITEKGLVGDEIDKAILTTAASCSIDIENIKKTKPLAFFPFNDETKSMTGIFDINKRKIAIVKGAPELLLTRCSSIESDGKVSQLRNRKEIVRVLNDLTEKGMRVIGVAYNEVKTIKEKETADSLIFLGLLAFSDRPRIEAKPTVQICKDAGISIIMLTGDNLKTAFSIGKEIGLLSEINEAVEWNSIKDLSTEQLHKRLKEIKIVARSTPLAKLKVVETLIEHDEIIAVTGDGVNDAPALKKAHVGVVMGSGSDVSKEAGSLVLLDDNFATLVSAVEQGRQVFHNILSFIKFQFTTTFAMLTLFIITFFLSIPSLLTPIQILFINIVMDGPPALALGLEKALVDVLKEKQRKDRNIFSNDVILSMLGSILFMLLIMGTIYLLYENSEKLLTATFITFSFLQLFNALNCRFSHSSFYTDPGSNPYIFASIFVMIAILVAVVYVPELQIIFNTQTLELFDWFFIIVASATILVFEEIRKAVFFKVCQG